MHLGESGLQNVMTSTPLMPQWHGRYIPTFTIRC